VKEMTDMRSLSMNASIARGEGAQSGCVLPQIGRFFSSPQAAYQSAARLSSSFRNKRAAPHPHVGSLVSRTIQLLLKRAGEISHHTSDFVFSTAFVRYRTHCEAAL